MLVGPVLAHYPRARRALLGQMCTRGTVSLQGTFVQKAQLELDLPDWHAALLQRATEIPETHSLREMYSGG